jgi:putative holliday junction resolvase
METLCPGRIMGIDYGEKSVGVAVSDELRLFARPLENVRRKGDKGLLHRLHLLAEEWNIREVVLGLPQNMDGTAGRLAGQVASFASKLQEAIPVPLHWVDERLSSWEAQNFSGTAPTHSRDSKRGRDLKLDSRAAAFILQRFLDGERSSGPFSR